MTIRRLFAPWFISPHTELLDGPGCRAIADNGGEKGGCVSTFFNGECALRPEKTSIIHRRRTVLGNRSVAFWTDDPYFRFTPGSGKSERFICAMLKNPTKGQVPTSQTYPQCLQSDRV